MVCLERLVAVADGMGGEPPWPRASSLVVAIVEAAFTGQSLNVVSQPWLKGGEHSELRTGR